MSALVQQTQAAQQGRKPIQQVIEAQAPGLAAALADRIGVDRFIRAAVTTFRTSPKLAQCTPESVLGGIFVAAQLGLEIGGPRGLVYLVPYGKEAQLVVGYRGFVDLFYRAGARDVSWFIVREGDDFQIAATSEAGLAYRWTPADLDGQRKPIGAVAQVRTSTGGLVWEYMTEAQILRRRPRYWEGTPWKTWPEAMWLKTVLRQLAKRVQTSTEVALAAASDETVQRRLPGLPEHVVEHVPVEGNDDADDATADDWEARERADHAAYVAEQESDTTRG